MTVAQAAALADALRVQFWGVRGSDCASGPGFVEFGGHTPCVEVRCGERLFVVDAGTGTCGTRRRSRPRRAATRSISSSAISISITSAACPSSSRRSSRPDRVIRTYCGNLGGAERRGSARAASSRRRSSRSRSTSCPRISSIAASRPARRSPSPDGIQVDTHPAEPSGRRHRLPLLASRPQRLLHQRHRAYASPGPIRVWRLSCAAADLVIYDGMFSEAEYDRCQGWGHSTWQKGVELCQAADVKALAIFHLYPGHDDGYPRARRSGDAAGHAERLRGARGPDAELRAGGSRHGRG